LLEAGHAAVTIIIARTKAGKDVDGHPFKPYTTSYLHTRIKHGLGSQRDLVRTGHMLGAMLPVMHGRNEVLIEFANRNADLIAEVHNFGEGTQQKSEFMDIRLPAELEIVGEALGDGYAAKIGRLLK
jgi:Xaa-Pro aminopeptidase